MLARSNRVALLELLNNLSKSIIQDRQRSRFNVRGDSAVMRFRDGSRYTCQRVGIAAKRDRLPHGVLKVTRIEERDKGRRHGPLARYVELILRSKHFERLTEVIAEHPLNRVLDTALAFALSSQQHRDGRGLCALDAFRMIVSHFCAARSVGENFLQSIKRMTDCGHPHCGPIAPLYGLRSPELAQ